MKTYRATLVGVLISVLTLCGCANSSNVAVKRGQQAVDPSLLPLACIAFTTDDIALPLETVELEETSMHMKIRAHVGTLDPSHPDILTALEGNHRSLSLVILHLSPGQYRLRSLEFLGEKRSYFTFDLQQGYNLLFTVKPGCVNYVGSLVLSADWRSIRMPTPTVGRVAETNFQTSVTIEPTARRDAKWAVDVVPGMASLPATESPLQNQ